MRHADVLLCPIGALAFYLYFRFKMSKEFNPPPDFTENETWYNVKLYTDATRAKSKTGIAAKGYGTAMSVVAHSLGIDSKHTTHLGRVLGPKVLEMLEFDQDEIRILGNWDPKIQESTYSTKVPMKVLRGMAGFKGANGMHYNPRSDVKVPTQLSELIFPWLKDSIDHLNAFEQRTRTLKPTARQFLKHMSVLSTVLIQDVAVIKLLHPERCVNDYRIFKDDPIWTSEAFEVSALTGSCAAVLSFYEACF